MYRMMHSKGEEIAATVDDIELARRWNEDIHIYTGIGDTMGVNLANPIPGIVQEGMAYGDVYDTYWQKQ